MRYKMFEPIALAFPELRGVIPMVDSPGAHDVSLRISEERSAPPPDCWEWGLGIMSEDAPC